MFQERGRKKYCVNGVGVDVFSKRRISVGRVIFDNTGLFIERFVGN